jgi:predicted secreted protein
MRKLIFFAIFVLILVPFVFKANAEPISSRSSSRVLEVELGKDVSIILDVDNFKGRSWRLVKPVDKEMLKFNPPKFKPDDSNSGSSKGKETWVFNTLKKGRTEIIFECRPLWKKDAIASEVISYEVIIK